MLACRDARGRTVGERAVRWYAYPVCILPAIAKYFLFTGDTTADDMHIPISSSDSHVRRRRTSTTSSSPNTSRSASPARSRPASVSLNIHVPPHVAHPPVANASGWSKANLHPGERGPWTRKRDGWGGVGVEVRFVLVFRLILHSDHRPIPCFGFCYFMIVN